MFFLYLDCDHRDLHVLTHSFPTRRSSDLEVPTAASHPGDNVFFIDVYGKNASYSIAYWRGSQNCHRFTGSGARDGLDYLRSEEHTSELQSLMRNSYDVFCLKKKK